MIDWRIVGCLEPRRDPPAASYLRQLHHRALRMWSMCCGEPLFSGARLRSLAGRVGELTCRYASIAFAACVLALAVGCMSGATISATPAFADSLPTPSKPKTVVDLLHNIRLAIQSGALLKREFYDDAYLLQYFGGVNVQLSAHSLDVIGGSVLGFDEIVAPTPLNGSFLPGMTLQFSWSRRDGTSVESELILRFGPSTRVGFDDVVQVFSGAWKKAPLELPSAHYTPDPITRPHGNQIITYEFQTAGVVQEMRVEFKGDGTIYSIYIKGRKEG
jgi:hypothetical protein